MKKWFNKVREEYQTSEMTHLESLIEWTVKRKFSFWGKLLVSGFLSSFLLLHYARPNWFFFLFYGVIVLSIVISIFELMDMKKK